VLESIGSQQGKVRSCSCMRATSKSSAFAKSAYDEWECFCGSAAHLHQGSFRRTLLPFEISGRLRRTSSSFVTQATFSPSQYSPSRIIDLQVNLPSSSSPQPKPSVREPVLQFDLALAFVGFALVAARNLRLKYSFVDFDNGCLFYKTIRTL